MEQRGFACDGGCGASIVLTQPAEHLSEHGWHTDFGPRGTPTLHACSWECMRRAGDRVHGIEQPQLHGHAS